MRASEEDPRLLGGTIPPLGAEVLRPLLGRRAFRVLNWHQEPDLEVAADEVWLTPFEDALLRSLDGLTPAKAFKESLGVDEFRLRFALHRLRGMDLVESVRGTAAAGALEAPAATAASAAASSAAHRRPRRPGGAAPGRDRRHRGGRQAIRLDRARRPARRSQSRVQLHPGGRPRPRGADPGPRRRQRASPPPALPVAGGEPPAPGEPEASGPGAPADRQAQDLPHPLRHLPARPAAAGRYRPGRRRGRRGQPRSRSWCSRRSTTVSSSGSTTRAAENRTRPRTHFSVAGDFLLDPDFTRIEGRPGGTPVQVLD